MWADGATPVTDNYRSWNITKKGLMFTLDSYQVASYTAAPQTVIVPDEVVVFSNFDTELKRVPVESSPNHFAIDKQNNLYTVADETVRQLKPIDFRSE